MVAQVAVLGLMLVLVEQQEAEQQVKVMQVVVVLVMVVQAAEEPAELEWRVMLATLMEVTALLQALLVLQS